MINKVTLIGRVGKDVEVKGFESGSMAKFSLATTESYKNRDGEWVEKTEWHNIVLFGKMVETIEKRAVKGNMLYIEGKIQTRSWDGEDGKKNYMTEVVAQHIRILVSNQNQATTQAATQAPAATADGETDDLPF